MTWIKFTDRECDLFTAYCIMQGYLYNYKKYVGKNFKNFLLASEDGIVHSWREKREYEEMLGLLKNKKGKFGYLLDYLKKYNGKLSCYLKIKNFDSFTEKNFLRLFKEFVKIYQDYFALFTLPKYFGIVFQGNDFSSSARVKLKSMRGRADYEIVQKKFLPLVFKKLEKLFAIKSDLFYEATPEEIYGLFADKSSINDKILRKRKKLVLFFVKNGKLKIFYGAEAREIIKREVAETIIRKDVIYGQTANPGKVTGKVRLILRERDLKNLRNKIIVCPMTSIKFVPFLKDIKAIITNEGGIACHAAIIAREMNKPCVIGTKVATKVLRDGDLVEVDAEKGEVKILNKEG